VIASNSVSRQHAAITIEHDHAMIEDLGSKNGTRVDGVVVTSPMRLPSSATIRLGAIELTYSLVNANAETETIGE